MNANKLLTFIFILTLQFKVFSQIKISDGGTVYVNGGETFYDAGGAAGADGNTPYTITLKPSKTGESVCVNFTNFQTYLDFNGLTGADRLEIYDGLTATGKNIGSLQGDYSKIYSNSSTPYSVGLIAMPNIETELKPGLFCATNPDGVLTFKFVNNVASTNTGWVGDVSTYKSLTTGCTADITADKTTICPNEAVILTATGDVITPGMKNDFNNGTIGSNWGGTPGAITFTSVLSCEPNYTFSTINSDNSKYVWMSNVAAPRILSTANFDVSKGGTISFDFREASDDMGGIGCESPDGKDEGIYLQYSTNNGTNWTNLKTLFPCSVNGGGIIGCGEYVSSWSKMTYPIPTAAQTTSTMFRWVQNSSTGAGKEDSWGIDNVEISIVKPKTITIKNLTNTTTVGSSIISPYNVTVNPTVNTDYEVTISDGTTSCTKKITIIVNTCCTPPVVTCKPFHPSCPGKNDGSIKLTGLAINTTYSVTYEKGGTPVAATNFLSNGSGEIDLIGLGASAYTKIVCTLGNCATLGVIETLTDPAPLTITTSKTNPTTCSGTDGKITISGLTNGKTYALSYVKDGPAVATTSNFTATGTTYDILTLGKGDYTSIHVTESGCVSNDEAQTLADPSAITITSTKTNPSSCSGTDGKITISGLTNGKTYALSYVKDGPAVATTSNFTATGTTYDILTLGKGDYTSIHVTESGCVSNDEAQTLADPSAITITSTKTNPSSCSGTDGKITISGLTNGKTYALSYVKDGPAVATTSNFTATGTAYDILTLGKGVYTSINVTESGCISNNEAQTLADPGGITITSTKTNPTTCSGTDGKITISGLTNGKTYALSYVKDGPAVATTSNFTATGTAYDILTLGKGVYTSINVTESGCISNNEAQTLADPGGITITSTKTNPTTCSGTDGKITISGLTNGKTYALSYVKDGPAVATTSNFTATGTTYDILTLGKGDYTSIHVTESGCVSNDEAQTLADPSAITITSTKTNPSSCSGTDGKITISGLTNGKTYALSYVKDGPAVATTSNFTATGTAYDILTLGKGVYTSINVTESGCISNNEAQTLADPGGITITSTKTNPTTCSGTDGKITISGLTNGKTYALSYVKDGPAVATTSNFTATGTAYDILTLGKGVYTSINVTESGCISNNEAHTLVEPSSPSKPSATFIQPTCNVKTGTITINTPTGNYSYSKDGVAFQTSPIFSGLPANTAYQITVKDLTNSCTSLETFKIDTTLLIPISATSIVKNASCVSATGSIQITAPIGSFYSYSIDGTNFQPSIGFTGLAIGNYTITTKTGSGCTSTAAITIKTPPNPPTTPVLFVKQPDCKTTTGTISVLTPKGTNFSYSLDNITYQLSPDFSKQVTGTYTIYVKDTTLCISNAVTNVLTQPSHPTASFSYAPTEITILNPEVSFTNSSKNASTYKWNFDDGGKMSVQASTSHVFPSIPNVYFVKLTASNGSCSHDTTIAVTIIEKPIIYIPNSFSPNSDEINNTFSPVIGGGISNENYSMYVYNKWGELIFESHNREVGWDGTYNNKICAPGTYIWKIEYRENSGAKAKKQEVGHVNLIY